MILPWFGDRHWPCVEVYEAWGDAFKRLSELTGRGYAATFREVRFVAASSAVPVPTPAQLLDAKHDGPDPTGELIDFDPVPTPEETTT